MTERVNIIKQKMKKLLLIFICSLAFTACELNDKVERVSTSGLDLSLIHI